MALETIVKAALDPIVSSRVYADVSPDNPTFPFIVYQQVGGKVVNFLEQDIPNLTNARVQVHVWSKTRIECSSLMEQVKIAMIEGAPAAIIESPQVSVYDDPTKSYGARIHFSVWH